MSVDRLLDDVDDELSAVWGGGLATPGPDRSEALRQLAERTAAAGLDGAAMGLGALADALEARPDERPPDRRVRLVRAHQSAQQLAAWSRTFRAAWSLEVARERLRPGEGEGARSQRPPGFTGVVVPVGLERTGKRVMIHALGVADRGWFVLMDELLDVDEGDPLAATSTSRLFQDRIVLADVLGGAIELRDHPLVVGGGRRVARPAFSTRPHLQRRGEAPEPPEVEVLPTGGGPVRVALAARRGPQGWTFAVAGRPVVVVPGDTLSFNLEKLSALQGTELTLAATVLPRSDGASILAADDALGDPAWPTEDPAAIRWAPVRLIERGDAEVRGLVGAIVGDGTAAGASVDADGVGAIARWWLGTPPEPGPLPDLDPVRAHRWAWRQLSSGQALPDVMVQQWTRSPLPSEPALEEVALRALCVSGTPGRALLEAHLSLLRRGVEGGGVLPAPLSLWAAGDALARLRGLDPRDAPVAALGLPRTRLRLLAVGPLGRWLRSDGGDVPVEALEALLLVLAAGEGPSFFVPGQRAR